MQRAVKRRPSMLCSALHFITSEAQNKTDENACVGASPECCYAEVSFTIFTFYDFCVQGQSGQIILSDGSLEAPANAKASGASLLEGLKSAACASFSPLASWPKSSSILSMSHEHLLCREDVLHELNVLHVSFMCSSTPCWVKSQCADGSQLPEAVLFALQSFHYHS